MIKSQEVKKELRGFNSFFNELTYKHDLNRVFDDFTTIFICCFAHQTQEDWYLETIRPYNRKELDLFAKMMAELLIQYNNALKDGIWIDPLGEYYELLAGRFKKSRLGQFFTPMALCDLISELTMQGMHWSNSVNDPCCGSGRFILSANQKVKNIYYTAQDIDPLCCKMSAINLAMHHIRGAVYQMNALSNEKPIRAYHVNPFWAKLKSPHIIVKI